MALHTNLTHEDLNSVCPLTKPIVPICISIYSSSSDMCLAIIPYPFWHHNVLEVSNYSRIHYLIRASINLFLILYYKCPFRFLIPEDLFVVYGQYPYITQHLTVEIYVICLHFSLLQFSFFLVYIYNILCRAQFIFLHLF